MSKNHDHATTSSRSLTVKLGPSDWWKCRYWPAVSTRKRPKSLPRRNGDHPMAWGVCVRVCVSVLASVLSAWSVNLCVCEWYVRVCMCTHSTVSSNHCVSLLLLCKLNPLWIHNRISLPLSFKEYKEHRKMQKWKRNGFIWMLLSRGAWPTRAWLGAEFSCPP